MSEKINICKYCHNVDPKISSSLRDSISMADLLVYMVNPEFKRIYDAEYCCNDTKDDAIDSYKREAALNI